MTAAPVPDRCTAWVDTAMARCVHDRGHLLPDEGGTPHQGIVVDRLVPAVRHQQPTTRVRVAHHRRVGGTDIVAQPQPGERLVSVDHSGADWWLYFAREVAP